MVNFCILPPEIVFVAQLVEQLTLNQWVQGSNPCEDTESEPSNKVVRFFILSVMFTLCGILVSGFHPLTVAYIANRPGCLRK